MIQINGTKKSAKFKTVLPPVAQEVQWLTDNYFIGENSTTERQATFHFHHSTRQSLIKNEEGKRHVLQKPRVSFAQYFYISN